MSSILERMSDLSVHVLVAFQLVEYLEADWLKNMLWLYLIGLIWVSEFIFACQQLALAGAVAYWYFR